MSDGIHRKFLETLGWTGQELEEFLPDWLNTARFLHLTDEDVRRAVEEWIPAYWNISLSGVRKSIAACIREAADTAKMGAYMREGKKVLYSTMPSCPVCITANKLAGEGRLEISYPYFIVTSVLGAFFNKSTDQLFNGSCMDPNCHHCGMNCMRADSVMSGTIPKPTVTWNWGLQCNESRKTDEMIFTLGKAEWDNVLTTIPHDAPLGDSEADDDERVEYLKEEIRVSQEEVTQHTGIEVREEHLRAAVSEYMSYLKRIEHLTDLVMNADPQPLTGNELALMGICMESAFNTGLGWLNDAIDTAIAEVEELIREGRGVLPKGAPKLACHFNPLNIPWIEKTFRDNGVNLTLGRMFPPASFLIRRIDENDIYTSTARMCLSVPNTVNMLDEARMVTEQLQVYAVDGVLYGFFSFDRWIGALEKAMIRVVEEKTSIPHFYLEAEFWNSGRYSPEDRLSMIRSICNCGKLTGRAEGK